MSQSISNGLYLSSLQINLHYWSHLHQWSYLHYWSHLHYWSYLHYWSHLHYWSYLHQRSYLHYWSHLHYCLHIHNVLIVFYLNGSRSSTQIVISFAFSPLAFTRVLLYYCFLSCLLTSRHITQFGHSDLYISYFQV